MPFRRLIAFTLDLLVLAFGGLAGFLAAVLTVDSRNTIASMGNIVIVFMLAAGGCIVVWVALVWMVTFTGRSPGQRMMRLRYDASTGRRGRACHYLMAWVAPVVLVVAPLVSLDVLGQYRNAALERWEKKHEWKRRYAELSGHRLNLEHAHRSGVLKDSATESEYERQMREYNREVDLLQRERTDAVWFVPEWLVEAGGILWLLLVYGPLVIYALVNLALLRRPPHAAAHDRITGARIVAA